MNPCKITTTVGLNIGKIDIAGVRFNFWDLGGQEELRSLWDKVIDNLIYIYLFYCKKLYIFYVYSIMQNHMLSFTQLIHQIEKRYLNLKKLLVKFKKNRIYIELLHFLLDKYLYFITDRVISSEHLIGVPLLVLANKQDVPDCMGVREVKPIFNKNAHLIGRRDCMVMPVSALNGYVNFQTYLF